MKSETNDSDSDSVREMKGATTENFPLTGLVGGEFEVTEKGKFLTR